MGTLAIYVYKTSVGLELSVIINSSSLSCTSSIITTS